MREANINITSNTRTIYVARQDRQIFIEAIQFCQRNHISLSVFIADALKWYLERLTNKGV